MELKKSFTILLGLILVIPIVCAFTATISNPRMVLYENITAGETLTMNNSVIVVNDNDYKTSIKIKPLGDWKDKIQIPENNFTLDAWERKEVFYKIEINKAGAYVGDVLVTFFDDNSNSDLSLAQELEIYVKEQNKNSKITGGAIGSFGKGSLIITGVLLLVLIILIIYLNNKRSKK